MMPCHGSLVAGVLRRCFSRDSRTTADRLTPLRRASLRASWASSLGKEIVVRMKFHRVCRYECYHGDRESAGHDQVGASLDGRSQNMNVIGVRLNRVRGRVPSIPSQPHPQKCWSIAARIHSSTPGKRADDAMSVLRPCRMLPQCRMEFGCKRRPMTIHHALRRQLDRSATPGGRALIPTEPVEKSTRVKIGQGVRTNCEQSNRDGRVLGQGGE